MPSEQAKNRADLLKRLFAVTLSVGFANQLIQMDWIKQSRVPTATEVSPIIFLLLGLFLILQSWEGYFAALETKPLERPQRFYMDVAIVFAYLVLLIASHGVAAFLFFTCVIFFMYIVWDLLTFYEYHEHYGIADNSLKTYSKGLVAAFLGRPTRLRHKLSTIVAFVWFIEIYGIYLQIKRFSPFFYLAFVSVSVFVGLYVYRLDQRRQLNVIMIFLPILAAGVVLVCFVR